MQGNQDEPPDVNSNKQPLKGFLAQNLDQLIRDTVPYVRVIITNLAIMLAFLGSEKLLFAVFRACSADAISRFEFVSWLLDGVEVLSIVAISAYFVLATIVGLRTQWRVANRIERQAGLHDDE